jgi:hypothetical protein
MYNRTIASLALIVLALVIFACGGSLAVAPPLSAAQATPPPRPTLPPQRPTLAPSQPSTPRPTEERRSDEAEPAPSATTQPTAAPSDTAVPPATIAPVITPPPPTALPRSGQPASLRLQLWTVAALALLSVGGLLAWRSFQDTTESSSQ